MRERDDPSQHDELLDEAPAENCPGVATQRRNLTPGI